MTDVPPTTGAAPAGPRDGAQPGVAAVRESVALALLPLRAVDEALHARAVDYVVSGRDLRMLREIASFGDAPHAVLHADRPDVRVRLDDERLARLKSVGVTRRPVHVARSALYRDGALSAAQWARLGRILEEAHRAADGHDRRRGPDRVPARFDALLLDVLHTADARPRSRDHGRYLAEMSGERPGWNADRMRRILLAMGVGDHNVLAVVFTAAFRRGASPSWCERFPADLPGVVDHLADRADDLPVSLLDELGPDGRRHVVRSMAANAHWAVAGARLLAVLAVDASRELRREAVEVLRGVDPTARGAAAASALANAPASRAVELVELLAWADDDADLLDEARRANPGLAGLIARTRARRDALVGEGDEEAPIEVPPFAPIEIGPGAAPAGAELRAALDRAAERGGAGRPRTGADRVTDADLDALVAAADGESRDRPDMLERYALTWIMEHAPSLTLAHVLRLQAVRNKPYGYRDALDHRADPGADPRALSDLIARVVPGDKGVDAAVALEGWAFESADPRVSWPWFAERPGLLREVLGRPDSAARALEILGAMPRLPAGLPAVVAGIAVGDSKVNRPLAQWVLRSHPRVRVLAEQALGEGRAQVRASAAAWVGSLGQGASVPALTAALDKERREEVRAALLAALGECGGDLSEFLSPGALGAEAARGLKGGTPSSLSWFSMNDLPAVHWADGEPVPEQIIRWWVVLADRLKDPDGRGIIALYLSLLEAADAAALAARVVRAWIARDTRRPDPEESRAHAQIAGRQAYDYAQQWLAQCRAWKDWAARLEWAEREAAITLEDRIAAAYAEHQRTYVGSAVADKGLLAFAVGMDDGELAGLVRAYMRANPGRRAQFDALLRALRANGRDRALQVLLGVARRHKMAGIQATAAALVRQIASERGWSDEELADRAVPTAGFDGDGLLRLSYGDRDFTGRLTSDLKIRVTGPDGRSRAGLPAPRAGEDAEAVRAAKKRLSAARKEAKAILTAQTERLYEAMCASRTWSAPEWRELLVGHPLVGRLVTRLIWTAAPPAAETAAAEDSGPAETAGSTTAGSATAGGADPAAPADPGACGRTPPGDGTLMTFRPAEDGALIGADDAVVELDERMRVGLAHGTLLGPGAAAAWRQHLADYGVEPLFDQLSAVLPSFEPGCRRLDDLQGHVTDALALRGAALKRGYRRGETDDEGFFNTYVKGFAALGLSAVLGFTGSWMPEEENVPCATTSLSFTRGGRPVPLDRVPPVLLAECRADYAALAALGPYDPGWRIDAAPR